MLTVQYQLIGNYSNIHLKNTFGRIDFSLIKEIIDFMVIVNSICF